MSDGFSPMSSGGTDVDIVTGRPLTSTDRQEGAAMASLQQQVVDAVTLEGEVASPVGQKLIKLVEDLLAERIDEFIRQDERCRTCVMLLQSLGKKTVIARSYAQGEIDKWMHYRAAR